MSLSALKGQLRRDLLLAWRRRSDVLNPMLFATMTATLLPFAMGPELSQLSKVAAAMTWISVLLANLISLDALFRHDADEGGLDLLLVSGESLTMLCAVKLFVHWLTTSLPLVLLAPLLASMLGLAPVHLPLLFLTLLIGSVLLTLIGGICAALTVGMHRSGILLALLALPLYTPVLIFAAGAMQAQLTSVSPSSALWFLTAGLTFALPLAPLICAVALRLQTR